MLRASKCFGLHRGWATPEAGEGFKVCRLQGSSIRVAQGAYDVGHGIVGVESSGKVYASAVYVLAREPGQLMLMMLVRFEFRGESRGG